MKYSTLSKGKDLKQVLKDLNPGDVPRTWFRRSCGRRVRQPEMLQAVERNGAVER